jgi:acetylornithine deacetylase/succinyl-diaminopimelate desuccinylase-like protein
MSAIDYARSQHVRFLLELKDFLRIPSISALPEHKSDMVTAAEFLRAELLRIGMENVQLIETEGEPLVYADWLHAAGSPTCLFYGHYDVQPTDPIEEWESPPFEPAEQHGNLYARGASDDKGQLYIHIKALESLLHENSGKLPINVRLLMEGEEEVGGKHVSQFVREHSERLRSDFAVVSDTKMVRADIPSLYVGLRGIVYVEIEVNGPSVDLHSGIYGGNVRNPLMVLAQIISQLKDEKERVLIPGFYDSISDVSVGEKLSWQNIADEVVKALEDQSGVGLFGEEDFTPLERAWSRPTLDVHGIVGGFSGTGTKTVIPAKAVAKISMRIVPGMQPQEVLKQLTDFIHSRRPIGTSIEIREVYSSLPVLIDVQNVFTRSAADALERVFGNQVAFVRSGGSIPIVADFQDCLEIPTLMIGFGLPDDRTHAPNEKLSIDNFFKGIEAIILLLEDLRPSANA